jgi:hypothetical protein
MTNYDANMWCVLSMPLANRRCHSGFPDTIIYIELYSGFKSFNSIQNYNQFIIIYPPLN